MEREKGRQVTQIKMRSETVASRYSEPATSMMIGFAPMQIVTAIGRLINHANRMLVVNAWSSASLSLSAI